MALGKFGARIRTNELVVGERRLLKGSITLVWRRRLQKQAPHTIRETELHWLFAFVTAKIVLMRDDRSPRSSAEFAAPPAWSTWA